MIRREFITLLGGAAAWPVAVRAQQDRTRRIGLLLVTGPEPLGPFREALADLGYVEGKPRAETPAALSLYAKISSAGRNVDVIQRELCRAGPRDR